MSKKDFTDWNGRKRKEIIRPTPDRDVYRTTVKKKDRKVSFKTKVDRYKALVTKFREYRQYRRDSIRRWGMRDEARSPYGWSRIIRRYLKDMRKMRAEYIKEGIYDKVREAIFGN